MANFGVSRLRTLASLGEKELASEEMNVFVSLVRRLLVS